MLKIKAEEVIAIGDSYNDIEMLQFVGMPICVDNAHEKVKKISREITDSNNNDGVRKIIEKHIL